MRRALLPLLLLSLAACEDKASETGALDCDASADADGDGLDDCAEIETWGTDPDAADSDGDGLSDGEEADCVSDPLDAEEQCYACGWGHNDPGDFTATGADEGDVIADVVMIDQCGEPVSLYDLAGEYHVLFMTAAW